MSLRTPISVVMTSPPVTVRDTDSVADARALMFEHRFHHMPVVDATGTLVGILSSNDLLRVGPPDFFARPRDVDDALRTKRVGEAMTTEVVSVRPVDSLERAAHLLELGSFHCLPVATEDGHVIGIVTSGDVIRYLARKVWEPSSPYTRPPGMMVRGHDSS